MNKFYRSVAVSAVGLSLALATTPAAVAQSSQPQPQLPDLSHLTSMSSDITFKSPFAPSVLHPSPEEGRGLQGAIESSLARQGYTVDHGAVQAEALKLAQRGYNGEIRLDHQGISDPLYFGHGEGLVSRVSQRHEASTIHFYLTTPPPKVNNPKRAGVATWAVPGGDIYIGQFFSYSH